MKILHFVRSRHALLAGILCALLMIHPLFSLAMEKEEPIAYYSGNSGVSLMFNVYENSEAVEAILDILDRYGVKASFFLGGVWAVNNEDLVLRMKNSGHDIGNHGYLHKLPTSVGQEMTEEEILRTDAILTDILGEKPFLYAPPSGDHDQSTVEIAHSLGYKTILWSADTIDWRDRDETLILKRAVTKIMDGGFLLMHPTDATVKALPMIIESYAQMGFEIRTVSENLK